MTIWATVIVFVSVVALLFVAVSTGVIYERINAMNQALTDAIAGLTAEVTDSQGKLASITTYLQGLPDVVAAAVAAALEAANAEATAAAAQVEAARQAISDSVDSTLAAINANPAPGETTPPTETPPVV